MRYFAPLLAGFDSQLKLQLFRAILLSMGGLSLEVHPIQSNLRLFSLSKKTRAFERGCIVAKKGAKGPIFEGNMLPQKCTPFSYAVNGTLA
jgi:hypothetical protein